MIKAVQFMTIAFGILIAADAHAAKYSCKSAKELARLGTYDSDTVTIYADDNRKECRFSINGQPAGSPPRDQLIAAINTLRAGQAADALKSGNVDWLGLLLSAASPEDAVPKDLLMQLQKDAGSLYECMTALERSDAGFSFDNQSNIFCRALDKGGQPVSFKGAHEVQVQGDTPYFVIGAEQGGRASYLFIPVGQYKGNPLQ